MSCGSSCGTGGSSGCSSKMNVFDWLSEMEKPKDGFDAVEVKFKGGRKAFFRNSNNLNIITGDAVVIEASPGHDLGHVSATGEIVRLQMKKNKVEYNDDLKVIYRIATERDIEKHLESKNRELSTLYRTREICKELEMGMKMSDVEFQSDNTKATFYYSADDRVDFRELIKRLAGEFRIKVEMRQISLRQEAGRLGGIGSCGRELCCSTWLTDFKNVSTSAARYQNLSLNPSKLSGQCGRLKCCLNYELDTYIDALSHIPEVKAPLKIERGTAKLQKTDIFKRKMWFGFDGDSNWYPISVDRVKEIQKLNAEGVIPHSLELDEEDVVEDNTPLNSDLRQLDKKYKKKGYQKKKKKPEGSASVQNKTFTAPKQPKEASKNPPKRKKFKPRNQGGKPNTTSNE